MRNRKTDVVVHLKETLAQERLIELQVAVAKLHGVERAETGKRLNRLILVNYDAALVSAREILGSIQQRGVNAQLIGM